MALADWLKRLRLADDTNRTGVTIDWRSILTRSVNYQEALSHPAIWKACQLLCSDVAKIPIDLYRTEADGSRVKVRDHPSITLLRYKANNGLSGFAFRKTLTLHALITGNGYAWIKRSPSTSQPQQLIILDPINTRRLENGYWETTLRNSKLLIREEDLLHIKNLSWDGISGLDPLRIMSQAIQLELGVLEFAQAFFRKGYALFGFLKSDKPLSPKEIARIREEFKQGYAGTRGAHEFGILHGGLEFQPLTVEPERSQLVQSRDAGLRNIANMFGVPSHKLGDPSRTSYASIEAENTDYLQTCLDPWLVEWEAEANLKLLDPESERDMYFEHNRNAIMRTRFTERVDGYGKLVSIGVLSPNEVRELENLNKRPGGDSYYVPANWIPATSESGSQSAQA